MPSACANVPPGAILPGLTERKPSGIPAATVSRPWGFGQFQLSFPVKPRRIPRSSGNVRAGRRHPLASRGGDDQSWREDRQPGRPPARGTEEGMEPDDLLCSRNARPRKTLAWPYGTSRRANGWEGEKAARAKRLFQV
jgi:hypothetical protein